ncbi:thioredoxin domain-containing protein, partial [Faunimonas sp. B44]|uniref:thioredoxin domain-containing protein n=1 Tax=Faunimonas sp. B44 TaxID=3461493 RepID=UPI0040449AE9
MNRLSTATSPYLLQHADNPVDWWQWSPEAFAAARERKVAVHLSIGYAACHWCHVMAAESFSDPETAALLNRAFVNIKVDREERPDVDQIYMRALQSMGQQGGWPLTMFLSPEGEPFWGGTYFPPEPRWGRPSFRQVATSVSKAWASGDPSIAHNRAALVRHLNRGAPGQGAVPLDADLLDRAAATILSIWDGERGSFRGAPKFPNAPVLDLLWRGAIRTGRSEARQAVLTTLRYLCQGGIYDHVGGGLARYSVDADWLVPHFEKMLYDNGQFLTGLSLAFAADPDPLFRARIEETVDWLVREMRLPGGAFASSLDADTEHEEGLTYVWTAEEIDRVLGAEDAALFKATYGVTRQGNWEGKAILNRLADESRGWLGAERENQLRAMRAKLLAERDARPQPGRDDKVLADWNGTTIQGLAAAATALDRPEYLAFAEAAYRFVRADMAQAGMLGHSWRSGTLVHPGMATDHAQMIAAALALLAARHDAAFLADAIGWFETLERHYLDPDRGTYFLTADTAEPLITRPTSDADEALPSANGVMAQNCAFLHLLTGEDRFARRAEAIVRDAAGRIAGDVVATASIQAGFDTMFRGRLVAVTGTGPGAGGLLRAALAEGDPAAFVIRLQAGGAALPPGLAGKPLADEPALYVCTARACSAPAHSVAEAAALLAETRRTGA